MMYDIEQMIYTRIKYGVPSEIREKYPETNFTLSELNPSDARFPTVYIHLLSATESFRDTEADEIYGVNASFQIEAYGTSMTMAKDVINSVCKIMKKLSFEITQFPIAVNTGSVYRYVARFQRVIASDESL